MVYDRPALPPTATYLPPTFWHWLQPTLQRMQGRAGTGADKAKGPRTNAKHRVCLKKLMSMNCRQKARKAAYIHINSKKVMLFCRENII